ncbi:TPA: hypothetical protein DD449_01615 [Candidatus Berkelbacteria bacterium]|uniref:Uncharacterized protein n=1 Tax=Berkelbacteria bacterium GW2011_GWE1_39_12 TaxID=1618337 RepID=A0A0G4B554_9BACT|nr:MAG: hypothetical protein UT28_C0001G0763 [Berkelbacteria bacterium GW2011_GWE1_39_12]HBO60368.1 hypothetical protein [Candidatus Berkelbacteria bacterium]
MIVNLKIKYTNDKEGKVFVLLRIFEGDRTPYYILNDPNIYIRTGSITKRFEEIAHPDVQKMLFEKKNEAKKTCNLNNEIAASIYDNKINQSQLELDRMKATELQKPEEDRKKLFSKRLGIDGVSISAITLQPYYPAKNMVQPKTLMDEINEYRVLLHQAHYPQQERSFTPIPNGIFAFHYNDRSGGIRSEQIFTNGLFCDYFDISEYNPDTKEKVLAISHLIVRLKLILHSARKFYVKYGYQGGLTGNINITNTADARLGDIHRFDWGDLELTFLPSLNVPFELDTVILNDDENLKLFLRDRIEEIYWCFGLDVVPKSLMDALLA